MPLQYVELHSYRLKFIIYESDKKYDMVSNAKFYAHLLRKRYKLANLNSINSHEILLSVSMVVN